MNALIPSPRNCPRSGNLLGPKTIRAKINQKLRHTNASKFETPSKIELHATSQGQGCQSVYVWFRFIGRRRYLALCSVEIWDIRPFMFYRIIVGLAASIWLTVSISSSSLANSNLVFQTPPSAPALGDVEIGNDDYDDKFLYATSLQSVIFGITYDQNQNCFSSAVGKALSALPKDDKSYQLNCAFLL